MKRRKFYLYLILTLIWMMVIFGFSAQPGEDSSKMSGFVVDLLGFIFMKNEFLINSASFIVRKAAHMSEYAILAILLHRLISETTYRANAYPIALIGAFLYACSDEFHQLFIPGRAGLVQDVLIDTCGALLGLCFLSLFLWMIHKKNVRIR